jgi:predicted Zn-dependent protease
LFTVAPDRRVALWATRTASRGANAAFGVAVGLVFLGCDGASTSIAEPTPLDASCPENVGPELSSLGPCCVRPNYLYRTESRPLLFRWEQFPLQVSVDTASLRMVRGQEQGYRDGIVDGLGAWADATRGVIGRVNVGFDLATADIRLHLSTYGLDDECANLGCRGSFSHDEVVSDRVLRKGVIELFPQAIDLRSLSARAIIGRLVAHEMGHALGLMFHSDDPLDLMGGGPAAGFGEPYPWASSRDLNTMMTAYCR